MQLFGVTLETFKEDETWDQTAWYFKQQNK